MLAYLERQRAHRLKAMNTVKRPVPRVLAWPCPFCGAYEGRPCRTRASGFREPSAWQRASRAQDWVRYGVADKAIEAEGAR